MRLARDDDAPVLDRNVPLYQRFGFEVHEEFDLGPVHMWAMLRPRRTG